jgi:arylsulfatase A-like enzyme
MPPKGLSGKSLVPVLTGKGTYQPHDFLFFEFHEGQTWQAIVWNNRMKAVQRKIMTNKPLPIEIYDLAKDPSEARDVANDHPELVKKAEEIFRQEHTPNVAFPLPGEKGWEEKVKAAAAKKTNKQGTK